MYLSPYSVNFAAYKCSPSPQTVILNVISSHVDSPANLRSFAGNKDRLSSQRVIQARIRKRQKRKESMSMKYTDVHMVSLISSPMLFFSLYISHSSTLSFSHVLTLGKQMPLVPPSLSPSLSLSPPTDSWYKQATLFVMCLTLLLSLAFLLANALSCVRILPPVRSVFFVTPAAVYSRVSLHPFLSLSPSAQLLPSSTPIDWRRERGTDTHAGCERKRARCINCMKAKVKLSRRLHLCSMKIV